MPKYNHLRNQLHQQFPLRYTLAVITHWNLNYRKRHKFEVNTFSINKALNGATSDKHRLIIDCIQNLLQ